MKKTSSLLLLVSLMAVSLTACDLTGIFGTAPVETPQETNVETSSPSPNKAEETSAEIEEDKTEDTMVNKSEEEGTEEVVETEETEDTEETESPAVMTSFQYVDYSSARFEELNGNAPFALYFHADWCPTCRKLEDTIQKNISSLPKGATFLKVDYDTAQELKKTYGITVQTTVVFFDANGNQTETIYNPSLEEITNLLSS